MYNKLSYFYLARRDPPVFSTLGETYNNAARGSRKRLRLHERTRSVWRPAITTREQPGERSLGLRGGRRGAVRGRPRRSRPNKSGAVGPGASQVSKLATPRRRRGPFRTEHLDIYTRCTYSMDAYILDVPTYRRRRLGGGATRGYSQASEARGARIGAQEGRGGVWAGDGPFPGGAAGRGGGPAAAVHRARGGHAVVHRPQAR